MKKEKRFRYLGKNGIVTTSVQLEGIKPINMYRLIANKGKVLTDGEIYRNEVEIFAEDLDKWTEINIPKELGQE